jgi:hypothetical protein
MNLVELPDDAVSAAWGPEIAAIAGNRIAGRNEQRLLSNTLAHQWWGGQISPATMNDAWITNGMSRYAELMYLEDSAGKNAFQAAVTDISAGALAYDTEPLTTIGRLDPFSPQFQSMTLEKGAMVFHMLRWEMGDDVFNKFLRPLLSQYTDKSIRTSNVEPVAQAQSNLELTAFFAQWLDGTGAPSSTNCSVFRLGDSKDFRTVGPWAISTSSACRSSCASKPTADRDSPSRFSGRLALLRRDLRPPAPRSVDPELALRARLTSPCASPCCADSNRSPRRPDRGADRYQKALDASRTARSPPIDRRGLLHAA